MKKNDKTIDKLSSVKIRSMGLDEPSVDFTLRVMQTIAEEQPVYSIKQKNYWWLLTLIPIFAGIFWYFPVIFEPTGYVYSFWTSLRNIAQLFTNNISTLFTQLKNINIPPIFLIGFIAILSLLTIEEIVSNMKHRSI